MKLKGTLQNIPQMPQRPVGPMCQKAEPSEAEGSQCRNEISQLQTATPWETLDGAGPTLLPPLSPHLPREVRTPHLTPSTGSTCHTSARGFTPSIYLWFSGRGLESASPRHLHWMNNFIFWSVNPSLPVISTCTKPCSAWSPPWLR